MAGLLSSLPGVAEREAFIRWAAPQFGIDPNIAVRGARSEGLGPGIWQSNVVNKKGYRERSYGDFQLNIDRNRLGAQAAKAWGYDVSDPKNWMLNDLYALNTIRRQGWGQWYGPPHAGITGYAGVDRSYGAPASPMQLASTYPGGGGTIPAGYPPPLPARNPGLPVPPMPQRAPVPPGAPVSVAGQPQPVYPSAPPTSPQGALPASYALQAGQNPWSVAKMLGVSWPELVRLNQLTNAQSRHLPIGYQLQIPGGGY